MASAVPWPAAAAVHTAASWFVRDVVGSVSASVGGTAGKVINKFDGNVGLYWGYDGVAD